MNKDLFEKMDKINSMDKPDKEKKLDECADCTTRGNCNARGEKCNDYVKDNNE